MASHFGFRRMNSEYGIHLQGQQIKQISGPASFYYLKPTKKAWNAHHKQGTDLPLLVLMGDIHFQHANRCQPCSPPSCYAIEDKSFLRLFDRLAEHTPIDFFTESSKDKMEETKDPEHVYKGIMGPLLRTTQRAHRVSHRSLPFSPNENQNTLVPTTRWHYTNVRNSSKWIESQLIRPFLLHLRYKMEQMKGAQPLPPSPPPISEDIRYLLSDMISDLFVVSEENQIEITTSMLTNLLHSLEEEFADQSGIMKQYLQSAIRDTIKMDDFIPHLTDVLSKHHFYRRSLSFFIKGLDQYPEEWEVLKRLCDTILLNRPFMGPSDPTLFHKDVFIEATDHLIELFHVIQTFLMDLYFLFRMLKQPKNSITSTLCLAYFGDTHIQTIVQLMTSSLFEYKVVYQNKGSTEWNQSHLFQPTRCLTIESPLYLEKDIIEHHQLRFGNSSNRLSSYYQIIQNEKRRRGNASIRNKNTTNKNKNKNKNKNTTNKNKIK